MRAKRGLVCLAGLLAGGSSWAAGAPLSASALIEHCRSFEAAPASAEAGQCESYIRGFLAASRLAGVLVVVPEGGAQETFSERALRTRLGAAPRYPPSRYCMEERLPMARFVAQLLALADARSGAAEHSASAMVAAVLGAHYLCRTVR